LAWFNKGWTPDNLAQAHSFFDRAMLADPSNVDARADPTSAPRLLSDRTIRLRPEDRCRLPATTRGKPSGRS